MVTLTTQELSRSPRRTVFPETRQGSPLNDWTEPDIDFIPEVAIFADFITDDKVRRVFPDVNLFETYFVFDFVAFPFATTDADTNSPRP
jgi:hypothetical protein